MISKKHLEYKKNRLCRKDLTDDPVEMFMLWYDEANKEMGENVDAMALATVDSESKPHSRIVLLKEFSEDGFIFFSNYESEKGRDLSKNPYAALLFFWPKLERQVRIEGKVNKTTNTESDTYWDLRSRGSQIGARISAQSSIIPDRSFLIDRYSGFLASNEKINRPIHWGGYSLVPDKFEFWQGREHRLNDRFVYTKNDRQIWEIHRLAP